MLPPGSSCEIVRHNVDLHDPDPEAPYKIQHGGYFLMTTRTPDRSRRRLGERVSHVTVEGGGAYEPIHRDEVFWILRKPNVRVPRFRSAILNEDASEALQAGSAPGEVSTIFRSIPLPSRGSASNNFTFPAAIEQFRNSIAQVPAGIVGNPNLIPQCEASQLQGTGCPPDSQVGWIFATLLGGLERVPLYNMVPGPGYPAQFGFSFVYVPSLLTVAVRPDYGLNIENKNPVITLPLSMVGISFWGVRRPRARHRAHGGMLPGYPQGIAATSARPKRRTKRSCACPPHARTIRSNGHWKRTATSIRASRVDHRHDPGAGRLQPTRIHADIEARPTTNVAESPTGFEFNSTFLRTTIPTGCGGESENHGRPPA